MNLYTMNFQTSENENEWLHDNSPKNHSELFNVEYTTTGKNLFRRRFIRVIKMLQKHKVDMYHKKVKLL